MGVERLNYRTASLDHSTPSLTLPLQGGGDAGCLIEFIGVLALSPAPTRQQVLPRLLLAQHFQQLLPNGGLLRRDAESQHDAILVVES